MSTPDSPEIVRYHTAGRRQPQLIGKDPSGVPIWGGPYTLYQVGGLATIPLLWKTRGLWAGSLSGIAVIAVIAMSTAAVIWLLGRIDFSGRNIVYAAGALLTAWATALRPGPRCPRRPGTRITGIAVYARAGLAGPGCDSAAPAPPATETAGPDTQPQPSSVQPTPEAPATAGATSGAVAIGRLSPLESFLAAADKVKVPSP